MCEEINDIFSYSLLLHIVVSPVIICFFGLLVMTTNDTNALVRFFVFVLSFTLRIYLFCSFGDDVIKSVGFTNLFSYLKFYYYFKLEYISF